MLRISFVDLTGVSVGTVNVPVNYYTQYVSGAVGETYVVSNLSSIQVASPILPTAPGFQQLYAIAIQGLSSNYTLSGYYGVETLTNTVTGQVVTLSLPQPPAGVNNYGVDLEFTDGSISLTANTSSSGFWTAWATQGVALNGNTQAWYNSAAVQVPATGASLSLGAWIAANPSVLNTADNSANVVFPLAYTVRAPVNYTTQSVSGPLGSIFALGSQSPIQVSAATLPTASGFQQLYAIALQGRSSDYTLSGYFGVETLTNTVTGQVVTVSLPQPPAGVNNYGVDLEFTDGSISLTGNTSPSGLWTVWATQGVALNGNTQAWYNSAAVQVPVTGSGPALQLGTWIAANPSVLNTADNSAKVVFPTGATVAVSQLVYTGAAAGDAFNATDATLTSSTTISDVGVNDSLNVMVNTGGNGAVLHTTGITTINVTNTTSNTYLLDAADATGVTTVEAYQSSGSGTVVFGNLGSLVAIVADGSTNGILSASFLNPVVAANSTVTLTVTNGATSSFAVGSQNGSSVFTTINIDSQGLVTNTIGLINTIVNGVSGNATAVKTYSVVDSGATALTVSYSAANGVIDASAATGRETLALAATATTVTTIKGSSAATTIDVSAISNYFGGATARIISGNSGNDTLIVGQDFNASAVGSSVITGIQTVTGNIGAGGTRQMDASTLPGLGGVGFFDTGVNGTDVANFVANNLVSGESVIAGRAVAATINYGDTLALNLKSGAGAGNNITAVLNGEILSTLTLNDSSTAPISTLAIASGTNNSLGSVASTLNAANTTQLNIVAFGGAISVGTTALNAASLANITITGTSAVVMGGKASSTAMLSNIDAHALTGDLEIESLGYQSTATITGGSGNDIIAWNFTTQGSATLDGGVHSAGSASRNTLVVSGTENIGLTTIDLTQTGAQVTTVNGSANSSIQKNFQNVNATGITGRYGVNVTAGAQSGSEVGSHQNDTLVGNSAGGIIFNGNGGADQIQLGAHNVADTVVALLSYNVAATSDMVTGFQLDTAVTGDILQFGSTTLAGGISAAGWSVSKGMFSYSSGGTGGVAGFQAALASATTQGVGAYYDGTNTWVVYSPDATVAHQNMVELVGTQASAIDNNGVAVVNAVYIA